jgi:hypothetical protein
VRSCESCHDNKIALGLGDPKRNIILDSESFFSTLKNKGIVLSNFQPKQVVTEDGDPIQSVYPNSQARFLNSEEIAAIKNKSDVYKAFRYLDLKAKRFPRLLAREDFPFDQKHKKNEESAKQPKQEEETLFEANKNSFMTGGHEVGQPLEENFKKEAIQNETIMEFLPNNFDASFAGEPLNSEKDILGDDSGYNSEGLE